ncbi:DUF1120 domain-containing protein [Pseudomonas rhodesiae]|uniref:DUF1120 domain-containing protein n=1 Tax=Pseudomonas rhodesiae TaxID=76760 RepID=UPI000B8C485C|nr:DUF1120 domain-containing protein [Pseudomonas rhodesiae]OXS22175.1 hypothetical protein CGU36_12325 [Pseudomonas fluorescens]OZO49139.1 hypothetical protein CGU37_11370 [Pseudomonas fluorescens]TGY18948.1 DUF1120 domain-containing protein [Pseudomonas fluorescens]WLG40517.1 DUF1120 domain-containing protein [Pseudomonas rhodesiae]
MPPIRLLRQLTAASLLIVGATANALANDECQLTLSESLLDLGLMNRLAQTDSAPQRLLGERRLRLTLACPQAQDLNVFYRALAASAERLQFTEHGSYALELSDGVVDGRSVELGLMPVAGQPPAVVGPRLTWRTGHLVAPVQGGAVVQGKNFSLQLSLSAWADRAATYVRDATTWEVNGTFEAQRSGRYRELTLRAHFAPVACTPQLSNGGLVDYGTLLAKDLSVTNETPLPTRTLQMTVSCDAPVPFALRMHDNREGSATGGTDETAYGLDRDGSQNKIGRFYVNIDPEDFSADAYGALYRTDSTSNGAAWSSASARQIPIAANSYMGFTHLAGSTQGPVAIQHLSGTLRIKAYLAPTQSLDLRQVVQINGSGTLEIIYL